MVVNNKESLFEYIDNHIKKNGTLPKEFNLDDYIANEEERDLALGALDGLSYFHTKIIVFIFFFKFINFSFC